MRKTLYVLLSLALLSIAFSSMKHVAHASIRASNNSFSVVDCSAERHPPGAFTVQSGGFTGHGTNCNGIYSVANTPTTAQAIWVFDQPSTFVSLFALLPINTDGARVDYQVFACNDSTTPVHDFANISQQTSSGVILLGMLMDTCIGQIVVWTGTSQHQKLYADAFQLNGMD